MSKKRSVLLMPDGPYPCYFQCGRQLETKYDRQAIEGWEWFTGYGEGPIHFCPQCRRTRQYEIDRIREKLDVRPDGYPDVRVRLDDNPLNISNSEASK